MSTIEPEIFERLAEASQGAYEDTEIDVIGFTAIDGVDDPNTGFSLTIYRSDSGQDYIFAFRGTELSAQDIYTDLNAGMKQWSENISQSVDARIRRYTAETTDAIIHFTGHSLGGALAQFAAYEYAVAASSAQDDAQMAASFDLVTFNALGGVLALSDSLLYPKGYDASTAATINAAHFKIKTDVVSRLGDDHVGGELLVVDRPSDSPIAAHAISNFTGVEGVPPVAAAEYQDAVAEENYLNITQLISVSGIVASIGDDGLFNSDEAVLRAITAFSFGLVLGDSEDLTELVAAFFGDASSIGQLEFEAWMFLGERAIEALQHSQVYVAGNVVGAYSLILANVLQWSAQFWEEHPGVADAIGLTIEGFVDGVIKPGMDLADSALLFSLENEFLAEGYQDAVDFITNTSEWVDRFFTPQSLNEMYIEGTGGDDVLSGNDDYWDGKHPDDHMFGYAGNDSLAGGKGSDFLSGGTGADRFYWNWGDGDDVIGDYDDAGDRIIINGVDLATLQFKRVSSESGYFVDGSVPDITLHYEGDFLTINVGSGPDAGSVTVTQYTPATGADYGIVLFDYAAPPPVATDLSVTMLGHSDLAADNEVRASAYDRQLFSQRGLDWSNLAIDFDAAEVSNYAGGALHGTLGGAFEGGPVGDYLGGDEEANALHGLAGVDTIEGKGGDDFLEGGAGSDALFGGDGSDLIFGSARAGLADALDPGSLYGQFYLSQIADDSGDTNTLAGGGGDDGVSGGEHTDYIDGEAGSDYLLGGAGADFIDGGADRDIIYGDSALHYRHVELSLGVAGEQLEIAYSSDPGDGGQFDDLVHAGPGDDTVWGELGDDELHGEDGADNLIGDRYHDLAYFSAELPAYGDTSPELNANLHGNDRLYGGAGSDLLLGLAGDDLLAGGTEADSLSGGPGDDVYAFFAGDGLDAIDDTQGTHTLLFSGIAMADLQVLFQGDQVLVGSGYGAEGVYLSKSEWANVRIALDTPDTVIERSRLDTLYLDSAGNLLLTVDGTDSVTEAERDALFTVDDSDPDKPTIVVAAGAEEVELVALEEVGAGATLRVVGGGFQFIVELAALQLATGLDFLSLADGVLMSVVGFSGEVFGSDGADRIIGSSGADTLHGGAGGDQIEGRGGDDVLDGGSGNDLLRGEGGDDELYGGDGSDYLDGGSGNDVLDGGIGGKDTVYLDSGDGLDRYTGPYLDSLEFGPGVNADDVVLYYTGTGDSDFRIEYGPGDAIVSEGDASSYSISGVTVDGLPVPLVQRSERNNGDLHDTLWNDVFEPGGGKDTLHLVGSGEDVFRFSSGDGQDTVMVENGFYPHTMGEIRLGGDIQPAGLSFSFLNGSATIGLGGTDKVTLVPDTVHTFRDNTFTRFTMTWEADPDWIPLIQPEGYAGNIYGSFGADHIVGNDHSATILPGYGNDLIEAGEGIARIVLNDFYFDDAAGIGQKQIRGEGGNDILETPLHQGLVAHYGRGDGSDTIIYDWSYSASHPYNVSVDAAQNALVFQPYGQDTLEFGADISLADLSFIRTGETLSISLADGSGGIRAEEFFHAYEFDPSSWTGDVSEFFYQEGDAAPDSLLHPAFLAAMPATPVAALRFSDGSVYDMAWVLGNFLEVSEATLLGTEGDDELTGTNEDDVIHALGGNDFISDFGGSNTILAGAGDDYVLAGSDSVIDPGPGDDVLTLPFADHVVQFGTGSGSDVCYFDVDAATATVELAAGITLDDLVFTLAETDSGLAPLVTLAATGDSLLLVGTRYNVELGQPETVPDSLALSLRMSDGSARTGSEIYALAQAAQGQTIMGAAGDELIVGTPGNDVITGGPGNDTLQGAGGDDLFVVQGRRHGRDHIEGGEGFDTVAGGDGDDAIGLTGMSLLDSIELIDGGPGLNSIVGSGAGNTFDFRATDIVNIALIDGRGGRDWITGSHGDDVIKGGSGDDVLSGGAGGDSYVFGMGDGRDVIRNGDAGPGSVNSEDSLQLIEIDHDQVWLSRKSQHLFMNIAGATERVVLKNWYVNEGDQLDAIYASGHVLMRDQVDQLVNAMAAFDVPEGVGSTIPEDVRLQLEPVLAAVWQPVP